jgi:hypothetical protein
MASTLGQLAKEMRDLAAAVPVRANEIKQQVARTINFDLLETTPVDTGLAMSNWIVALDEASADIRGPFVGALEGKMVQKDKVRTWTHRGNTEATRQANKAPALALGNATIDSSQPGQEIHLTNNLPYIQALDEGHSSQAALFVDRAIILGEDLLTRAIVTK